MKIRGRKTVGEVLQNLESKGVSGNGIEKYSALKLIAFKAERSLEVIGIDLAGSHHLIKTFPFTGFSGNLGPKLREGDRQIPEGIYKIEGLNPNSAYHLSIKLNYPNDFDREMAALDGRENPGSDIFIHGKSGTVGCIPIGDEAIEELFLMVSKIGIKNVSIILAPHDFRKGLPNPECKDIAWTSELYASIRAALRKNKL